MCYIKICFSRGLDGGIKSARGFRQERGCSYEVGINGLVVYNVLGVDFRIFFWGLEFLDLSGVIFCAGVFYGCLC